MIASDARHRRAFPASSSRFFPRHGRIVDAPGVPGPPKVNRAFTAAA
jgi:hypothetical protein